MSFIFQCLQVVFANLRKQRKRKQKSEIGTVIVAQPNIYHSHQYNHWDRRKRGAINGDD